jgi:predicted naringenin-chalcone synthase
MFLSRIRTLNPPHKIAQQDCLSWLATTYLEHQTKQSSSLAEYQKLLKRVGCAPEQIAYRYSFLPDFNPVESNDEPRASLFGSRANVSTSERQAFFKQASDAVFEKLYEKTELPNHLIHVSCTGYVSPSGAQLIAARKSPDTLVTHAYHMGCYAAFPALRMASGFLSSPQLHSKPSVTADVVHTELCTLHMSPEDPTLEQMVIQSLFADGVAAYRTSLEKPAEANLEVLALGEFLVPDSNGAMEWSIGDHGMAMTLSKDVPSLIGAYLREALLKWEKQLGFPVIENFSPTVFAIHPGGPKIIDSVKNLLELSDEQIRFSREVLFERGNMSSATVPHIWKKILESDEIKSGTPVISMAFGPGLTLCLSLMRVHK